MNKIEIKKLFSNITVWKRKDHRAPHKPLLILYVLSDCIQNGNRFYPYEEIDKKVGELLLDFAPARKVQKPEEPFWRLIKDGIWELENFESVRVSSAGSPRKGDLKKYHTQGRLKDDICQFLKSDHELLLEIVNDLLINNFPESIHEDILQAIGLDINSDKKRQRDPKFRDKILRAYEYKCAVCGFDVRVGHMPVALEAAHIKWHQASGPDTEKMVWLYVLCIINCLIVVHLHFLRI